jgi:hypothetical protein
MKPSGFGQLFSGFKDGRAQLEASKACARRMPLTARSGRSVPRWERAQPIGIPARPHVGGAWRALRG